MNKCKTNAKLSQLSIYIKSSTYVLGLLASQAPYKALLIFSPASFAPSPSFGKRYAPRCLPANGSTACPRISGTGSLSPCNSQ